MSVPETSRGAVPAAARHFVTTRWTMVLTAGASDTTHAQQALEKLCQTYWYPLYAYVRRQGHSPEDAQDLTQEFFARFLAKNYLGDVDRSKGKFRSFLIACLKHYLSKEYVRRNALKRGGGQALVPLDGLAAETRYCREPADAATPDKLFERQWALTLLEQVLARLAGEYDAAGKRAQFEQLQGALTGDKALASYREIGERLGLNEGAVKVAVHRLRQRYRELLRDEIAQTVADPAEVDDEIRYLFSALGK
jgi:RNA polymerase sigma factor (sigma-70 family)